MEWVVNDSTRAKYFVQGNTLEQPNIEWLGWPATKFTRCRILLEKKNGTLQDLVSGK